MVLLVGNGESPMNYKDNPYPFRQDSNFLYFIGIDRPDLVAIIDCESGLTTLFGNERTVEEEVWMGKTNSLHDLALGHQIDRVQPLGQLSGYIGKYSKQNFHYPPPYRVENAEKIADLLGISLQEVKNSPSKKLIEGIVSLRSYKEPAELREMEIAVNISGQMHARAMQMAVPDRTEGYLKGLVQAIAVEKGQGLSYPAIITVNGQYLHIHEHGNLLQEGKLLLGDFGACSPQWYAGDITRTFPTAKRFSPQQKAIYEIVLSALNSAIASIRPGITYRNIHWQAARIIFEGLKALGITKGDVDEAVHEGAHALFFPHGLGHMIGLDVHDMEDLGEDYIGYDEETKRSSQFGLRSLRLGKKLEKGFTLTVEPGIYFIPSLIESWSAQNLFTDFINYGALQHYLDFGGVRIEDNVLVTETGVMVLGQPIPKSVEEVESLRSMSRF
jgi:Xaa-Pro aminopeptidase